MHLTSRPLDSQPLSASRASLFQPLKNTACAASRSTICSAHYVRLCAMRGASSLACSMKGVWTLEAHGLLQARRARAIARGCGRGLRPGGSTKRQHQKAAKHAQCRHQRSSRPAGTRGHHNQEEAVAQSSQRPAFTGAARCHAGGVSLPHHKTV